MHGSGARLRFAGRSATQRAPGAPREGPAPRRCGSDASGTIRADSGTIRATSKRSTHCRLELRAAPHEAESGGRPAKKSWAKPKKRGQRAAESRRHRQNRGSAWRKLAECGEAAQLTKEERAAVKRQLALDIRRQEKADRDGTASAATGRTSSEVDDRESEYEARASKQRRYDRRVEVKFMLSSKPSSSGQHREERSWIRRSFTR